MNNLLLKALPGSAFEELEPHLERVRLRLRDPIEALGQPIQHVYFFETALGSNVAHSGDQEVEVSLCGRDGISGLALVLGMDRPPFESFVQVPGEAFRVGSEALRRTMESNADIRALLLRYVHAHYVQVVHTALSNARHIILERIARWLLMCHDRVPSQDIQITHEFLALMLGVRRAGITTEMHVLEGEGAVANRRGCITICDRARLQEIAGSSYGVPEDEYERTIGQTLRRVASSSSMEPELGQ